MKDMLRASLLALPKNPRRNHLRFYCMVTAEEWGNPSSSYRFGSKLEGVIETSKD